MQVTEHIWMNSVALVVLHLQYERYKFIKVIILYVQNEKCKDACHVCV